MDKTKEYSCALCAKKSNIFEMSMQSCSHGHFHYVCHGCVLRLVSIALNQEHMYSSTINGQFTFIHRDLQGNITNKEAQKEVSNGN